MNVSYDVERIRAVALFGYKDRKSGDQLRNIAAGGADLDRDRDSVAIVFDQKITGNFRLQAVFSASHHSPSLVVPSPTDM